MHPAMPDMDWRISEVVERCPRSVSVFIRFRMACVGCAMAPFETLAEAAAAYGLNPNRLLRELHSVQDAGGKRIQGRESHA